MPPDTDRPACYYYYRRIVVRVRITVSRITYTRRTCIVCTRIIIIIIIIIRFGRPRCPSGTRRAMVASLGGLGNRTIDTLLSVRKFVRASL